MNKLLVSDIINIADGNYILEFNKLKSIIKVKGIVKLYLTNINVTNLEIILEDNASLTIYLWHKDKKHNMLISLIEGNNTNLKFNYAFTSNDNNELIINNVISGNKNNSQISIRGVSNKNLSKIIINVEVLEKTINNIALEDLKGINNGGFIHIEPNIKAASNEVMANHLTTIGGINKDNLNYLLSKGIKESLAQKLILKGFIFSNMDEYIKEKFGGE